MRALLTVALLLLACAVLAEGRRGRDRASGAHGVRGLNFNPNATNHFLYFAFGSYCQQNYLSDWTCKYCVDAPGFELTTFFNDVPTNTFGYAGYDSSTDSIVLVFRGTQFNTTANLITDLSATIMTNYPGCSGCEVGLGFLNAYESIQPQVSAALDSLLSAYSSANVTFVGHSLGGALAVLAAADMTSTYTLSPQLFTYGNPRIGNKAFYNYFGTQVPATQSTRLVWNDDIVPHLPPQSPFGFVHEATEVWWQASKAAFKVCSSSTGEDPKCSDSVPFYDYSISDHFKYEGQYETGSGYEANCRD